MVFESDSDGLYSSDEFKISYEAGDTFNIYLEVNWGSLTDARDLTFKIYSKQALTINDSSNQNVIYHMDG